jgi:Protein of unknown function (DUF3006)
VPIHLSVDRFEGKDKSIAVLVSDDGATINLPKSFLPPEVKAGDVLAMTLERDEAATIKLAAETRKIQDELLATDPGGDITL